MVYMHEFGHSYASYKLVGGSYELILNPFRYVDRVNTILMPLVYLLVYQAPPIVGGAVHVHKESFFKNVAISFAGPFMSAVGGFIFLLLLKIDIIPDSYGISTKRILALMVYYQAGSFFFNLLPIPPRDGFSIVSQFLPQKIHNLLYKNRTLIFAASFYLFLQVPEARTDMHIFLFGITETLGIDTELIKLGKADFYKSWQTILDSFMNLKK